MSNPRPIQDYTWLPQDKTALTGGHKIAVVTFTNDNGDLVSVEGTVLIDVTTGGLLEFHPLEMQQTLDHIASHTKKMVKLLERLVAALEDDEDDD